MRSESSAGEHLVYEHLGVAALSYLLAVETAKIEERFGADNPGHLDEARESVIAQLVLTDGMLQDSRLPEGFLYRDWVNQLTMRNGNTGLSMGNFLRQLCGGEIHELPTPKSRIEELLNEMTVDAYPGLLVREPTSHFMGMEGSLIVSFFRHPANREFQELVHKDDDLAKLFPKSSEHAGWSGNSFRSTGQGGSHQLWTFADSIISVAWRASLLEDKDPAIDRAAMHALQLLQAIRSALRGEEAVVPVRIGLAGVLLPEGLNTLDLGWARIRRSDERDDASARRSSIEGELTTTTPDGETVKIKYSGDLVLECELTYKISLASVELAGGWPEELQGYQEIEEMAQNIRLGLLLACPVKRPILVTTWRTILDPLSPGNSIGWSDPKQGRGLMPVQLSEKESDDWAKWAKAVAEHRTPGVGVAVRRILAAVAERRSPEDVLVDAVIVWENLFGARSETTLRISSSLAWLLGTSKEDRLLRQTRYKKIYSLRSDVVHGAAKVDQKKISEESLNAVMISVDALRAVFGDHQDLLKLKDSETRSLHMIHGGDRAAP